MLTHAEAHASLPEALRRISPDVLRYVLPDYSITVDPANTWCNHVTFTVTHTRGLMPTDGQVKVTIKDLSLNTVEGPVRFPVPPGRSVTMSYEWPMPADAEFHPDFFNELEIELTPESGGDRDRTNNKVRFTAVCVG